MYLASAEVRWFHHGEVPGAVLEWFQCGPAPAREPVQIHQYLRLPGCTSVGVKLRNGRFEIKARQSEPKAVDLPHGQHGYSDQWLKWSAPSAPAVVGDVDLERADGEWISVSKDRRMLWFPPGDSVAQDLPSALPGEGCAVELSVLEVRGHAWWTLGFEAVGTSNQRMQSLKDSTHAFLANRACPVSLQLTESCAYPEWLTRVIGVHDGNTVG